jgi:hypothetical protein
VDFQTINIPNKPYEGSKVDIYNAGSGALLASLSMGQANDGDWENYNADISSYIPAGVNSIRIYLYLTTDSSSYPEKNYYDNIKLEGSLGVSSCSTGSFSVTQDTVFNCGGSNVGSSGATITISPDVEVIFNNVGTFEAATISGSGSAGTGCNNGQNAAERVTINANTIQIGTVTLNGGSASSASCSGIAGDGGNAGSFTATATGDLKIDSISASGGNGQPTTSCSDDDPGGDAGEAGTITLTGANIGGLTGSMTITANGGTGGNGRDCGGDANEGQEGDGAPGGNVVLSTVGTLTTGAITLIGGNEGNQPGDHATLSGGAENSETGEDGGSITVTTPSSVTMGAIDLRAGSFGGGDGGSLTIESDGPVTISSFTSTGDPGGTLDVDTSGAIVISSSISVYGTKDQHDGQENGGDGGAVILKSTGSTITTNTINAYGGNAGSLSGSSGRDGGNGGSVTLDASVVTTGGVNLAGGNDSGDGYGGHGGFLTVVGDSYTGGAVSVKAGNGDDGGTGGTADFRNVDNVVVSSLTAEGSNEKGVPGTVRLQSNVCVGTSPSCSGSFIGAGVSSVYSPPSTAPAVCVVVSPSS